VPGPRAILTSGNNNSHVILAQEEWVHPSVAGVPGGFDFDTGANGLLIDRVINEAINKAGVVASEIVAVSTTSMREGIVLYDEDGEALCVPQC
jgi:autoinducer-2 kinase